MDKEKEGNFLDKRVLLVHVRPGGVFHWTLNIVESKLGSNKFSKHAKDLTALLIKTFQHFVKDCFTSREVWIALIKTLKWPWIKE